jgi:hypothetical protein
MRELPRGISLPYFHSRSRATGSCGRQRKAPRTAATIINGMRPRIIGRAVGIGVRVAGRIAGQRLAVQGQSGTGATRTQPVNLGSGSVIESRAARRTAEQITTQARRSVSQGIGGFLRPFRRVGGILWLEVTGAFFLLFAAVFSMRLWQSWTEFSWVSRDFAVGAAAVFLYLGVSSFWRARRR